MFIINCFVPFFISLLCYAATVRCAKHTKTITHIIHLGTRKRDCQRNYSRCEIVVQRKNLFLSCLLADSIGLLHTSHIRNQKCRVECDLFLFSSFFLLYFAFAVTIPARWTTIHLPIPIFSIESTHHPHVCVCELALLSGAWLKFHYDICDERWHRSFNSSTKPINSKSIESGVIILKIDFISMQCICWGHEQQSSNLIREYYFILHVYTNNMMAYKQNLLWECYRKIWTMRMRRLYFDGLYLINFSLIILSMTAFNNFERLSPRKCMHLIRGRFWY